MPIHLLLGRHGGVFAHPPHVLAAAHDDGADGDLAGLVDREPHRLPGDHQGPSPGVPG